MRGFRTRAVVTLVGGGLLVVAQTSSGPQSSVATLPPLSPAAAMLRTTQVGAPTMQSINAPARAARVAVVPGTGGAEAWALGYTRGDVAGSTSQSALGQIVFLHYTGGSWQMAGPPRVASGAVANPHLFDLSLGPGGEGWAVGEGGTLAHHAAGSSTWQVVQGPTQANLEAVSVVPDGGGIAGYAVGGTDPKSGNPTALRLAGGTWTTDVSGISQVGTNQPGLTGVAAVSPGEAWAVSGEAAQATTAAASVSVQALYVFHRTGGTWHRVTTPTMFQQPPATANDGTTTIEAAIGGAVAANSSGAWVVGRLVPNESSTLLGDQVTGDRSRPFALWIPETETPVDSYCPAVEQVSGTGAPQDDKICANNFPLAAFGLDAAVIPPNASVADGRPELFAGGMGLFHYVHNSWNATTSLTNWVREADSVGYIASISLASTDEGWVAGTGSNAIGGGPFSETLALGHWTKTLALPALDRWPDPDEHPVEAVALAPDGSHAALATGRDATQLHYLSGTGWILQRAGGEDLHALAWPAMRSAWAVGNRGTLAHYDGFGWQYSSAPRADYNAEPANLFGVAFAGAGTGWAVGADGPPPPPAPPPPPLRPAWPSARAPARAPGGPPAPTARSSITSATGSSTARAATSPAGRCSR